jgi:short-subunit dehydrogenase
MLSASISVGMRNGVRDTIACISGATDGIGNVLAKTVPWPGARSINLSRRDHPDFENVRGDLTKPKPILQLRRAFAESLPAS